MDQLSELRTAVQSDLTVGSGSTLYPPATIDLAINRSYRKIGAMYRWEETRDALKTSSVANYEYYNYPKTWRSNSIWKLTVDGVDYGDPLTFKDYEFEKDNSVPSGLLKIWANYGKRFYIYPVLTTNGNKNISIWGYKFVEKLVEDTDYTYFSYSLPELNEAIVLEAGELLRQKGDTTKIDKNDLLNPLFSPRARAIVAGTWAKVSQEQAKLKRTTPQFQIRDMFATGVNLSKNTIGNFN